MARILIEVSSRGLTIAAIAVGLATWASQAPVHAQQPLRSTQQLARQVEPAITVYFDTLALADQSLQFGVAMRRLTPAQAAATLRERATQLGAIDLRGLDPTIVAEHRVAMTELMQQLEAGIASSNRWPAGRAPNDYKAFAQRTLQRLRVDYEQKLARGVAPIATAPALLVVFAWTVGETRLAPAYDWIAGDARRVSYAAEGVLTAAVDKAVVAQAAATPSPRVAQGPALAPPARSPVAPSQTSPTAGALAPSAQVRYMGCYMDDGSRDLPGDAISTPQMTVASCVAHCGAKRYAFAAVQYGSYCFCGNSYGKLGPANNCDMKCAGNPGETCGGSWANSVYALPTAGATGAAPAVPPATAGAPVAPPATVAAPGPQASPPRGVPIAGHPGFGPWQPGMQILDGADYRSVPVPNADPEVCLTECARDTRCRAVTYTMPFTYGASPATCWLKGRAGRLASHPSAISAIKSDAASTGVVMPPVMGVWLFRGIPGQRATIGQGPDGRLLLVTERNVRADGYVESATTIVADFPFARGMRGTLSSDGQRITWANGEFWSREASGPAPNPANSQPLAQCDISGLWRMETQNVGQSTWTFSPLGGGRYSGQEAGLGNASGTASMSGNRLRLDWRTGGGYSGVVELTLDSSCSSGHGRHVFYTGRTGSEATVFTRSGAR